MSNTMNDYEHEINPNLAQVSC